MQPHSSSSMISSSFPILLPELRRQLPWWNDISNDLLPELALPSIELSASSYDVVVIGAGIAGLSAALRARQLGAQVLVLDKSMYLGSGATGRNAGILSVGINMGLADLPPERPERNFWTETTTVLRSLLTDAEQPGTLLSAVQTGSLNLAETKYAARKLEREARERQALGLQAELWTAGRVEDATAGRLRTDTVIHALWLPEEGRVQPLTLLAHVARKARSAGVQFSGNTEVLTYEASTYGEGAPYWHIKLSNGRTIKAGSLVNAVGPTSEPNARIYALAFDLDLPAHFPLFWDASPYTYADYRPGNGRLGVSGGRYGKAGRLRYDARYYQRLITGTHHWLPELSSVQPRYTWAVDLYVTADLVPALRVLSEHAPGFAIEGLGALGVLPGIILGQRAAELICEQV